MPLFSFFFSYVSFAWQHSFETEHDGDHRKFPFVFVDGPANPYKPTYTFPDEYDGDLERMEDYIRKSAVPKLNNGPINNFYVYMNTNLDYFAVGNFSSSPVRTPTATIK